MSSLAYENDGNIKEIFLSTERKNVDINIFLCHSLPSVKSYVAMLSN